MVTLRVAAPDMNRGPSMTMAAFAADRWGPAYRHCGASPIGCVRAPRGLIGELHPRPRCPGRRSGRTTRDRPAIDLLRRGHRGRCEAEHVRLEQAREAWRSPSPDNRRHRYRAPPRRYRGVDHQCRRLAGIAGRMAPSPWHRGGKGRVHGFETVELMKKGSGSAPCPVAVGDRIPIEARAGSDASVLGTGYTPGSDLSPILPHFAIASERHALGNRAGGVRMRTEFSPSSSQAASSSCRAPHACHGRVQEFDSHACQSQLGRRFDNAWRHRTSHGLCRLRWLRGVAAPLTRDVM